uniref:Sulphate adenylyltransferase catalytic domain-containing protein n=1 Tax=Romanomermis culicivorax TaxID=13658 RepID=A0A915LA14_ROMCU
MAQPKYKRISSTKKSQFARQFIRLYFALISSSLLTAHQLVKLHRPIRPFWPFSRRACSTLASPKFSGTPAPACAVASSFYIVGRYPACIQRPDTCVYLCSPSHSSKVLAMAPSMPPNLEILPFQVAVYDKKNKMMTYFDESGTKMRQLAKSGQQPPDGFMAPAAWRVLANFYKN